MMFIKIQGYHINLDAIAYYYTEDLTMHIVMTSGNTINIKLENTHMKDSILYQLGNILGYKELR